MAGAFCVDACNSALTYAKGKGEAYAGLVKVIEDCVELCSLRENFERRGSALLGQAKALCADACSRCASACEAMNDDNLSNCIKECRACSSQCC